MKFHATSKDLLIKESERLISGSVNIYTCEFTFDESWDGYTVTAVFSTNGSRLVNMAVVDGKCEIPHEVLRPNARIRIGVFGIDGDRRRPTTYSEWIPVEQGVDVTGGEPQPPTPSVYEQWVAAVQEDAEVAASAAENAVDAAEKAVDAVTSAKEYSEVSKKFAYACMQAEVSSYFENGVLYIVRSVDADVNAKIKGNVLYLFKEVTA